MILCTKDRKIVENFFRNNLLTLSETAAILERTTSSISQITMQGKLIPIFTIQSGQKFYLRTDVEQYRQELIKRATQSSAQYFAPLPPQPLLTNLESIVIYKQDAKPTVTEESKNRANMLHRRHIRNKRREQIRNLAREK